jgi:hypothetical protein
MKQLKHPILPLLVMFSVAGLLAGCESDSVAPQENLPAPSQEDVASQAGIASVVLLETSKEFLAFDGSKNVYTYEFGDEGDVTGRVTMDFRCGGEPPDGTPCAYDVADWGRVWTDGEDNVTFQNDDPPSPAIVFTVDVSGPIDQDTDSAVIGGEGTVDFAGYFTPWTITDVEVSLGENYFLGGYMEFTSGAITVVVWYDGDNLAAVTVDDILIGFIDLDDGVFTEVEEE